MKMAELSNSWQGPGSSYENAWFKWPVDEGVLWRQRPENEKKKKKMFLFEKVQYWNEKKKGASEKEDCKMECVTSFQFHKKCLEKIPGNVYNSYPCGWVLLPS